MGKFLPEAMAQLEFAWKLLAYAEDRHIDLETLDVGWTFRENGMQIALREKVFDSYDDLIQACKNNLGVAFGAAAITLNRALEELNIKRPDPIESERDQFVSLVYQIRNAFAHDIAEPRWHIGPHRYRRRYRVAGLDIDLTDVQNGEPFSYARIGGPDTMMILYEYYDNHIIGSS